MTNEFALNAIELQRYQPNRYPFLMIDRVTSVLPGKYAVGYKNLTNNEWFFPKHFVGNPNMPGALQLESMAQMLTVAITTLEGMEGKITHALEHKVKFMREVLPGDRLDIRADLKSWKRGIAKGAAKCMVDDQVVSSAEMMITIPEIFTQYLPK
tara:strand:- start:573 stop:1034 length:462 start_codon:yes stop_codon:yes gene_type:complete